MKASAHKLIYLLLVYWLMPNSASAATTHYQTPLEQAQWQFSGDLFHCQLQHQVQGFGQLQLIALPDEALKLQVNTNWLSLDVGHSEAKIIPSAWQQPQAVTPHSVTLNAQAQQAQSQEQINAFLEALDQGLSWQVDIHAANGSDYSVHASPVNMRKVINQFRHCRQDLVPKPFSYVRRIDFGFESGVSKLNDSHSQDLQAIVRYVLADSSIIQVLVDGHADGVGEYLANLVLSKERADEVASRLVELGLDSKMIQVRNHGARSPIASDHSEQGRAYNRRVTVRLVKDAGRVASTSGEHSHATH